MDYTKLTDSEIDRLVAERIRGWHKSRMSSQGVSFPVWADNKTGEFECDGDAWHPSAYLNQAFEAVDNSRCHLDICFDSARKSKKWVIYGGESVGRTDNPARAICIALLEVEEAQDDNRGGTR